MSGLLDHSPADIIRYLLINLGHGCDPEVGTNPGEWPIYVSMEPSSPDDVITVFGTTSVHQGRTQVDGEVQEREGIQIRVRCTNYPDGYEKIEQISIALDEDLYGTGVTIDNATYLVHAWSRTSGPIELGKQVPQTKRELFTLNGTITVKQIS